MLVILIFLLIQTGFANNLNNDQNKELVSPMTKETAGLLLIITNMSMKARIQFLLEKYCQL